MKGVLARLGHGLNLITFCMLFMSVSLAQQAMTDPAPDADSERFAVHGQLTFLGQ